MIQDNLLKAALDFRDAELWKYLDDSMLFGVKLSDKTIAYCCVMGQNGEHYALGMYKGAEGLSSYYTTLDMANGASIFSTLAKKATFNHINCDFVNASNLDNPSMKDITKLYALQNGLKVRRSHGYPDFVRYTPFQAERFELNEEEQAWSFTCLQAATLLADKLKKNTPEDLGFDSEREYPSPQGGKNVPLVVIDDNRLSTIEQTNLPAYVKPQYPQVKYDNDFAAYKFKKAERHPNLIIQCKVVPLPLASKEGYPYALLTTCKDQNNFMFAPLVEQNYPSSCKESLTKMGENFLEQADYIPPTIEVADEMTEGLLKDFCKKCNIRLKKVPPERVNMDEFLFELMSMMMY